MPQNHLSQRPVDSDDDADNPPAVVSGSKNTDSTVKRHSGKIGKHIAFMPESLSSSQVSEAKSNYSISLGSLQESIIENRTQWVIALFVLAMALYLLPPQKHFGRFNVLDDPLSRAWSKDITSGHCKKAYPGRPLIQYVLMVDAGSMGSRIHAYKFNYCVATPQLESETFDHVEPGLSSYGEDPEGAAKSLDKLLNGALNTVPKFLHTSTPIAVKATAGLRLLGEEKSNRILAIVRQRLESRYPFPIIEEQGVAVMDGADEGVFAWVTVNYLLGRFNSLKKKPTVAILDLGGASTQVVFEPSIVNGHSVAQGTHRYPMNFNGNEYILYQHSHLGYGLMLARIQINSYVVDNPISNRHGIRLESNEYAHPCLPVGLRQNFIRTSGENVVLVGVSDPGEECRAVVEAIFNKYEACRLPPCSFNGVYQPALDASIEDDIYAFSFFFDLTAPFRLGSSTPAQEMTIAEIEELRGRVCIGDEDDYKKFHDSAEAMKEIRKSSDLCMDLSYIYGLLEYGYGVPKHRKIKLAKKLKGHETGWCVGASIAVLEERDWFNGSTGVEKL
ncbi:Guanosine-diphosphatase [Modicella reniformis]|uniref:guanosine-diphosphatase n=1 Tax=Modicella reniformis TaxID=1440133 RepID=A0A9P6M321_9FUNG|nr:Guanosine-diphosphatase [Modicella reniformis]